MLSYDVLPTLPEDLRQVATDFYNNAVQGSFAVSDTVLTTLKNLGKAKGDPEALQRGETMIRVEVMSQISRAKTDLQADRLVVQLQRQRPGPRPTAPAEAAARPR